MLSASVSLPVYLQISELLTREIAAGLYAAGDRLPPEAELAKTLGVAVGTLRKALSELELRGMLARRQGSGTYVLPAGMGQSKSVYEFFKLELIRGGGLPTARVIDFQKIATPAAFQTDLSKHCYRLRRLRLLSDTPIALEEIYFDAQSHPHLKAADLGEALYWFYQERLGFWIASAEDRVGVGVVPDWSVQDFAPAVASVCARVERVSRTSKNKIAEYSITWFDAKRCRYVNRLK
ncbi:MAG: GntR family transcriptional regulator [Cytophagales bacterium]|nr:GntR family transcriptional regulator [Cytophagales bacterium]